MTYLGILGVEFWKTTVIFEISTLKFVENESLTHIVNFGTGSTFSKGPGSALSESPGPGPGSLYKVCPWHTRNEQNILGINPNIVTNLCLEFDLQYIWWEI